MNSLPPFGGTVRVGKGRPYIVIQGGPGLGHCMFRPWIDPLAQHCELIFTDVYGVECEAPGPRVLQDCVENLRAVTSLCDDAVGVIAHSWGAVVASQAYVQGVFGKKNPLALVCPVPIRQVDLRIASQVFAANLPKEILKELVRKTYQDGNHPELMELLTPYYCHDSQVYPDVRCGFFVPRIFASVARSAEGYDYSGCHAYPPQMLCLTGQSDQFRAYISGFSDRYIVMDEVGHYPFAERPEAFIAQLAGWMKELSF